MLMQAMLLLLNKRRIQFQIRRQSAPKSSGVAILFSTMKAYIVFCSGIADILMILKSGIHSRLSVPLFHCFR
jgi:hypothetical protein